jgi:hypothetical protein
MSGGGGSGSSSEGEGVAALLGVGAGGAVEAGAGGAGSVACPDPHASAVMGIAAHAKRSAKANPARRMWELTARVQCGIFETML